MHSYVIVVLAGRVRHAQCLKVHFARASDLDPGRGCVQ